MILKVRDENILKTGLGGEYLVNNYFMRVKDIGKKRKILKRESDPESAEWNELKVERCLTDCTYIWICMIEFYICRLETK